MLGSDCQSAIHKSSMRQKVVSFNSRISEVVREFLRIRDKCTHTVIAEKIAAYQDEVKREEKLSFMEHINIQCDVEAKALIQKQISSRGMSPFLFEFTLPIISNALNQHFASGGMISDEMHKQLATPYLERKMNVMSINEID